LNAHELYALEPNWVQVDGDGRWAKPLEEPQAAYARRAGRATEARAGARRAQSPVNGVVNGVSAPGGAPDGAASNGTAASADVVMPAVAAPEPGVAESHSEAADAADVQPDCPTCGGRMWDNRLTKRNPKAPDFKCRDRSCDGVVWHLRTGARA
jgi:sRNA-binding protein